MKNFILTLALLAFTAVCCAQTPYSELFIQNPIPEYQAHNDSIEYSPEGRKILEKVMMETYATFAEENIKRSKNILSDNTEHIELYQEEKERMEKAQKLLPDNPEAAAHVYMFMGSCHEIWRLKKKIFKEKYGLIWYTPAELYPDVIFD